ncbi:MAG: PQQ-binding-like beta-propeller repeat protein, partial [Phycisphaerae bacterium]|nr:PQQ-binding-like beta-propeller repeat protein [Phycisphaerae bacterium]
MGDGRVVVSARRTPTRQETVSWLFCFDLNEPNPPAWASVVATVGSMSQFGIRLLESPVLAGAGLYLVTGTGAVARFDPATGAVVWLRRFNVPIRDLRSRAEQWDFTTPAVAEGKVFAVTPDGARVVVLDAETGEERTSVPTGPDTPLGSPQYLLSVPGTSRIVAVGTEVIAFDALDPRTVVWSWPSVRGSAQLGGRVTAVAADGNRGPSVVIPASAATHVVDGLTGKLVLQLETSGNALLLADQLLSADTFALASFMPIQEAERLCRLRLKEDAVGVDPALSLLQLARQSRRGSVAAEAASEAIRRLGISTSQAASEFAPRADGPSQEAAEDLFSLLLEVDAAALATGADAHAIEQSLDLVGAAIGQSQRTALARADRLTRRGSHVDAARELMRLLEASDAMPLLEVDGVLASLDAHALARLSAAAALDGAVVRVVGTQAVQAAQAKPSDLARLRTAARLAHAAGAQDASAQIVGMVRLLSPGGAARLAIECSPRVTQSPPAVDGTPTRVVEFPGRLCATSRSVVVPQDRVFTMQSSQLVLRKPPEFEPVWRANVGAPDPVLIGTSDPIIVWDERSAGYGSAVAIDASTGQERWRTTRTSTLMGRLSPGGDESEPQVVIPGGRSAPLAQVLPAVCGRSLVLTRRDGTMLAIDADRGTTELWKRASDGMAVAEFASDAATVVVGGSDAAGDASPRVLAVDAATGETVVEFELTEGLAPTLGWLRILPGGVLVVGSEDGVQARRLAGGDEEQPMWRVSASDVQGSESAWPAGRWLVVLGRFGQLVAIDAATGRVDRSAFRASEVSSESVRSVEVGGGWIAIVRESSAEFFDMNGHFLGRDVTTGDRSI